MSKSELQALLDYIYKVSSDVPHCGHCGRPLLLMEEDGATHLFCKHCAGLTTEEAKKE